MISFWLWSGRQWIAPQFWHPWARTICSRFFSDSLSKLLKEPSTDSILRLAVTFVEAYEAENEATGDFSAISDHFLDQYDDMVTTCRHWICLANPEPGFLNCDPLIVCAFHDPVNAPFNVQLVIAMYVLSILV